ncbi:MAG: hypothetical protein ABR936_11460 [Bacteroidota bacterium]|jgi:hypothetical protein
MAIVKESKEQKEADAKYIAKLRKHWRKKPQQMNSSILEFPDDNITLIFPSGKLRITWHKNNLNNLQQHKVVNSR